MITRADLKKSLPDTTTSLKLPGLHAPVEIYRDPWGVPHVRAQNTHDAFFGQAFAAAQDRLWHMDYDRHRAHGRWAEFVGQPGLDNDLLMRRFRLDASARDDYAFISDDARAMLDAYAEGVNAFIHSSKVLPIEYQIIGQTPEPWQPWDCLAVLKVRHILMGTFEGKLWRARLLRKLGLKKTAALHPGFQPGHLQVLPPGSTYKGPLLDAIQDFERAAAAADPLKEVDMGSNNWALSGERTATGKPIFAGDPHRGLDTPNVYYQNHLACPDFDAVGCSFPGVPGLQHFGHNAYVSWGVTHAGADYQDLFIERFDKSNPAYYEFKGQMRRAQVFHDVITVKNGKPVPIDVTVTHHGPVIAGDPSRGVALAFRYTQTAGPNRQAESLLSMLKARSTLELDQAMRHWVDPCNNFVMADVHGNIAYLTRGKIPMRDQRNAWLPVPGWTGDHEWKGMIPFEEMPRSHNPKEGYIVTANQKIVSDDYPYYIALDHSPDFRARRISIRLNALKKATLDQVAAIHAERTSIPAQAHLKALKKLKPKDALSKQALDILLDWDASMERDTPAPLIYSAYRLRLDKAILLHLLGPLLDDALAESGRGGPVHVGRLRAHFIKLLESGDTSMLPPQATWPGLMSQALADALQDLKSQLGPDMKKWTWGKVHHTVPKHPLTAAHPDLAALLNPPQMHMSGDGDVPQNTTWSTGQPYTISSTAVHRYAYDLSDWNNSKWIVPLGASGHPGSPHFADQAPLWSEIDYIPMLYDWQRISKDAESHQTLNPKEL